MASSKRRIRGKQAGDEDDLPLSYVFKTARRRVASPRTPQPRAPGQSKEACGFAADSAPESCAAEEECGVEPVDSAAESSAAEDAC